MKIKILDIDTLGDDLDMSPITGLGDTEIYPLTFPKDVPERIADADILVLNKVRLTKDNLPFAKCLKLICICATGYDNVDTAYCREHGIGVCNVAGYSTDSVAQLTLAMAFSLATNLFSFNRYVQSGEYTKSGIFNCLKPVFREMTGMTWGICGLGNIGGKVAKVAKAAGCRVLAYKRTPVDAYECCSLEELCRRSDIISLHLPLTPETHHIIDKKCLDIMKKNVIIINVSRGAVVDEEAVSKAVEEGKIGGLGVDVYSEEPMKKTSPYQRILGYENTIFTPHMAWGALDARKRCIDEVGENIKSYINGEKRSRIV